MPRKENTRLEVAQIFNYVRAYAKLIVDGQSTPIKLGAFVGTRVTGLIVFLGFRASSGRTCAFIRDLWFFAGARRAI